MQLLICPIAVPQVSVGENEFHAVLLEGSDGDFRPAAVVDIHIVTESCVVMRRAVEMANETNADLFVLSQAICQRHRYSCKRTRNSALKHLTDVSPLK
jgi:hypothetical protein